MKVQLAQVSALVGFLLPFLIAFLQHSQWSAKVRSAVALVAILVASALTVELDPSTSFTWTNWAQSLIVVFLMTKTSYLSMWKPTGLTKALERGPDKAARKQAKHHRR